MKIPTGYRKQNVGGRPRGPQPQFIKGEWKARHRVIENGLPRQKWFPLGTKNRAIADARNQLIIAQLEAGETPDASKFVVRLETFQEACDRLCGEVFKIASIKDRIQRLRDYACPVIGSMPVDEIRKADVLSVLEKGLAEGLSAESLRKLRQECRAIFKWFHAREMIPGNPCDNVEIPEGASTDGRAREQLTDEEFVIFWLSDNPRLLRMMAYTSRAIGGMRTSDLHEWQWTHISWEKREARVRRPKTDGKGVDWTVVRLDDEGYLAALESWWKANGCPMDGYVFPLGRQPNPLAKRGHLSYAKQIRRALRRAGITRRELHEDTPWSRRVDFHSFRRAYVTALGDAGVNAQTSMRLTGHKKLSTHLDYVNKLRATATPAGVVPAVPVVTAPRAPFRVIRGGK